MRRYIVPFIVITCLSMTGCARKTATDTAFDSVSKAINVLEQTLPEECRTEPIVSQIESIRASNTLAQTVCEAEINAVKVKYERLVGILVLIVAIYLGRFFLKI